MDGTGRISGEAAATRWTLPILLLTVFMSIIGFGVVIPLLPYYAHVFQAPAWQVALMFSAFSLGQFGGELTWGRLSDRFGRRPVLLVTTGVSSLGYVALAFAGDAWTAVAVRLVQGFFSGNLSVIHSYVADITPPERRAGRLALIGAAFGLGFVVGPALGGLLARPDLGAVGFRPPLFAAFAMCLAAGVGILLYVRETRGLGGPAAPRRSLVAGFRDVAASPVLARALAGSCLGFMAFSSMQSTQGLWAEARYGWGPGELGLYTAVSGAVMAASQAALIGRAVRNWGEVPTITLGLAMTAAAFFIQAFDTWVWPTLVAMVLVSVGYFALQPATTALVSRSTSPEHQGAMLGVNASVTALARITGPMIGGALFSAFGAYAPLVFGGLALLPAIWLFTAAGKVVARAAPA